MKTCLPISSPVLIFLSIGLAFCSSGALRAKPPEGELIARWKLADFVDNTVADEVGGVKLSISQGQYEEGEKRPVPMVEEVAGVQGLRFGKGQLLLGKTQEIAGLEEGFFAHNQPFSARIVFTVVGPPAGTFGILLDIGHYMRTGVNLLVEKETMRLLLQVNDGEKAHKVHGPTILEEGKAYTAEILFDGTHTTLLLNGEFECESDVLPLPFDTTFTIGAGNGDRYWFDGVISEISIMKPSN